VYPDIKDPDKRIILVGIRDRAVIAVAAYSGCRVGELWRTHHASQEATDWD